jgi:VWFA-related protein
MKRVSYAFCGVWVLCASLAAGAQTEELNRVPQSEATSDAGMDPALGRITIDLAVTDAQGNAVTGLERKDFKLLDEGNPLNLVTFDAANRGPLGFDPPIQVILVIDGADLSAVGLAEAEADVDRFLRKDGGYLAYALTVYRITSDGLFAIRDVFTDGNEFADKTGRAGSMRRVWSHSRSESVQVVDLLQIAAQKSAVAGLPQSRLREVPMPIAMKALGAIAIEQRRIAGRKLLFWIGPGWRVDLKGGEGLFDTITEFSTRLREARIELSIAGRWVRGNPNAGSGASIMGKEALEEYVKGVRVARNARYPNLGLQVLAARTGGGMLTTRNDLAAVVEKGRNDIPRLIEKHIAEASNYYRLTFDPPRTEAVDEYHDLKVEIDRPGLTAHTGAGYYDEPVFYDQADTDVKPVTAAELEQRLAQKSGDRELAEGLSGLKMAEPINSALRAVWIPRMPGARSREALIALADQSAFLESSAAGTANLSPPDSVAQQAILSRAEDYLAQQIPRLPNFYASRTTEQYGEPVPSKGQMWKTAQADRRFHLERTTKAQVFFEDGKEVVNHEGVKTKRSPIEEALSTTGTFGPILILTLKNASASGSTLTWSRWEQGATGQVAVFRYHISSEKRIFEVGWCCLAIDEAIIPFRRNVSFHGEIAIDPATGKILRLVLQGDLEPRLPLIRSSIVVEYGPVVMGGNTYFCPLRSVSMSRNRRVWELDEFGMVFKVYGPYKTLLNDVTFANYHLFRSESRILPGFIPVPDK